jgi:hypothetical protein
MEALLYRRYHPVGGLSSSWTESFRREWKPDDASAPGLVGKYVLGEDPSLSDEWTVTPWS